MPTFGSAPFPRRFGGSGTGVKGKTRLQLLTDSLNAQLGTAYDASTTTSNVYARNMALARCLNAAWSGNDRLANQWQPAKMTDFLARWEAIMGLYPASGTSDVDRRKALAKAFLRRGLSPTYQQVRDLLATELGAVFVGITHTPSASAYVITPSGWPMGNPPIVGSDGNIVKDWLSTVAYLAIQVTQPAGMSDGTFYQTAAKVYSLLDPILPAWVTMAWWRNNSQGVEGFRLDDTTPPNLDNSAFSP